MNNMSVSLTRRGRNSVRVRIIGVHSVAWGEMAADWGAAVECIVDLGGNGLNTLYRYMELLPLMEAMKLPPLGGFSGVVLATIRNEGDAAAARGLISCWKPFLSILSMPGDWSRQKASHLLRIKNDNAKRLCFKLTHEEVGGVTTGAWRI
eukprot:scaffold24773_cov227-Skeletonema_marinoi.AAC.1